MMESTAGVEETVGIGAAVRQTGRAAELAGHALSVLREEQSPGIAAVSERLADAVEVLSRARDAGDRDLLPSVVEANGVLGEVLQASRKLKYLPPRAAQALETVRRTIILLNGVARHHGQAVLPPPVPGRTARRSLGPPPDVVERRKSPRAFLETEVTFESADNFYTGFTEDVSEGGLFLATYDLRPMGSEIEVEFSLPSGHIVRTTGVVRWVRDPRDEEPDAPPGLGIQFRELAPEDREAIQSFIEERAPLFYED